MARFSSVSLLAWHEQQMLEHAIRSSGYVGLNQVLATMRSKGVDISRSAFYRYASKLRKRDAMTAAPNEATVVTILERSSGLVQVVKTSMPGDTVAALIEQAEKSNRSAFHLM